MSGFSDLCECLCRQLGMQMDNVERILSAVNGQSVFTSQGYDSQESAFGLPPRPNGGVSGSALATLTMVVLFLVLLLSLRRQVSESGQTRAAEPLLVKPASSSSGEQRRRDDHDRDGIH